MRLVRNLLAARVMAALAPFGLRSGAFSTMALIAANPGCSQAELGQELAMDKSAVNAILDELEAKGLAVRVRSAEDRRRHALTLTAEGERRMREMHRVSSAVEQPIREALSPAELEQLLRLLERAQRALLADETRS
ncbi:MAG: MarR family winged helix-turn-helix transcriptional regulator [Caulobacteraceae bacterium]